MPSLKTMLVVAGITFATIYIMRKFAPGMWGKVIGAGVAVPNLQPSALQALLAQEAAMRSQQPSP